MFKRILKRFKLSRMKRRLSSVQNQLDGCLCMAIATGRVADRGEKLYTEKLDLREKIRVAENSL